MEKYINVIENDKIIFKNLLDSSEIVVTDCDSEYAFDNIFINEEYDLDFIDYVVKKLKQSKDIGVMTAEYDSPILEKLLYENGLRVSNYQYTIKKNENFKLDNYEVSNILNKEDKEFYLKMINKFSRDNHQYIDPNGQYQEYTEKWFDNGRFEYRTYRKNGKIVGVVEYQNFDYYANSSNSINEFHIRCLFSDEDQVMEDILKDLLSIYKKDIIISITHNEKKLKSVVNKMDSDFDFCLYVLVDKDNNI